MVHYRNRMVVLTAEWLSWLHGLFWYEANCIKQPEK